MVNVEEVRVRVTMDSQGRVLTLCSARFPSGLRAVGTVWGDNKVKAELLLAFLLSCEELELTPRDQGIDPPALFAFLDERLNNSGS